MISTVRFIAISFAIALLGACATINVENDWNPDVDFAQFKTFALLDAGGESLSRNVDQWIRGAIIADLTAKGLRQVETIEAADLAVGYEVATEQRTAYQPMHSNWAAIGFTSHSAQWGAGSNDMLQTNYTVGTLIIAMYETDNKELVWEASGSSSIDQWGSPEQSEDGINDSIGKVLQNFPPSA